MGPGQKEAYYGNNDNPPDSSSGGGKETYRDNARVSDPEVGGRKEAYHNNGNPNDEGLDHPSWNQSTGAGGKGEYWQDERGEPGEEGRPASEARSRVLGNRDWSKNQGTGE